MKWPLLITTLAGVALVLSACGAGSAELPPAAAGTTRPASNAGGDRLPVQVPGENYGHHPTLLTGIAELERNGCWTIDLGDGPRLVVFPGGFTKPPSDGAAMVSPDGVRISDGMAVDGRGGIVGTASFPGTPDGFWGNYIATCDPGAGELVVLDSIQPAFAPQELSNEQLVAMLREADLTVSWGCGLGFTISSDDQRVALQLFPVDMSGPIENTGSFPSRLWVAKVAIGKNLMVNNCDDVVEGWEPEPDVVAGWRLIAGDFAFTPPADGLCTGGEPVEAQLTGVVVDTPLGAVELGNLSITNDAYGCFAG